MRNSHLPMGFFLSSDGFFLSSDGFFLSSDAFFASADAFFADADAFRCFKSFDAMVHNFNRLHISISSTSTQFPHFSLLLNC